MLILSRRKGECICIVDNIDMTVLETKDNQIRLGIQAPSDITIIHPEAKVKTGKMD